MLLEEWTTLQTHVTSTCWVKQEREGVEQTPPVVFMGHMSELFSPDEEQMFSTSLKEKKKRKEKVNPSKMDCSFQIAGKQIFAFAR